MPSWPAATFDAGETATPLKNLPGVDEIARLALFLTCDATCTTGETIVIDGGLTHLGAVQLHAEQVIPCASMGSMKKFVLAPLGLLLVLHATPAGKFALTIDNIMRGPALYG